MWVSAHVTPVGAARKLRQELPLISRASHQEGEKLLNSAKQDVQEKANKILGWMDGF